MGFGTLPDIGPERFDDRMKQTVESLVNDLGVSEDDRLCIKHAFELHYKMRRIFDVLKPMRCVRCAGTSKRSMWTRSKGSIRSLRVTRS